MIYQSLLHRHNYVHNVYTYSKAHTHTQQYAHCNRQNVHVIIYELLDIVTW